LRRQSRRSNAVEIALDGGDQQEGSDRSVEQLLRSRDVLATARAEGRSGPYLFVGVDLARFPDV